MSEESLIQRVDRICGPLWDAISPPSLPVTSIPKSYAMAISVAETGAWLIHNADVPTRFEARVYRHLLNVLEGREAHYGSITAKHLVGLDENSIKPLATSWSLTQIMGYHCLRWKEHIDYIQNPQTHYRAFIRLTTENCQSYGLDPTRDHEQLAEAWNGGHPGATTVPREYAQNVLVHRAAWGALHANQ